MQTELANAAGVSTRSVRNHRDRLVALGLVDVVARGWRLSLSFPTTEERRDTVIPASIADTTFTEAVDALLRAALPVE